VKLGGEGSDEVHERRFVGCGCGLSQGLIDGVEASVDEHRWELFGFERTRDISALSAQQIADTAARFGQEDDITVLTVRLSAVAAAV
jgi:hypothetical protein